MDLDCQIVGPLLHQIQMRFTTEPNLRLTAEKVIVKQRK